jgi:sterol desaturase/sphingolipid hydroxylase (fatty acid hydroxylase superfamily)/rhodanese-related sulfurtransferase
LNNSFKESAPSSHRNDEVSLADILLNYEPAIRIGAFGGVFAAMALWEVLAPRRRHAVGRLRRWPGNLGIVALDSLLVRLAFPTAAVGTALAAQANGWGLLPALALPPVAAVIAGVMLLDLAIYLQHMLFHAVPVLWRVHRMHHADLEVDATTGVRFHPIEILLSLGIKFAVIAALGAPVVAVVIFEVLLNATSLFNHGNVRLPARLDRWLRWLVVTPEMHRVHHSIVRRETNSNYGFNLPWWDRLFGTYRAQPEAGHQGMTIGIEQFRNPGELRLDRLLTQPFRDERPTGEGPRWIEVDDLAARLKGGGVTVIDVRGPDEFSGPLGHITDAINLPVDELQGRLEEIDALRHRPVTLVCRTDRRSARAAELLGHRGFGDIRVLRGGMEQWNRNGLPVEARAAPAR